MFNLGNLRDDFFFENSPEIWISYSNKFKMLKKWTGKKCYFMERALSLNLLQVYVELFELNVPALEKLAGFLR